MSELRVSSIRTRTGTPPKAPDGISVSGVATATTFNGNLTGNATGNVTGNLTGNVTGNISGATGTFSSNVSIGGTLTYEEVSAVDSVGVITARGGIRVGAGQSISAVSGIVTYYGDGSQLTGVQSGVFDFVASGTIANGKTVVVNTDGTVSVVAETVSPNPSVGTPAVFESAYSENMAVVYDSTNNKVVIAYRDKGESAQPGTAVVGTVSGTSISFGTPVLFESGQAEYITATYDSTNSKVIIAYQDNGDSNKGKAVVGTVSGTSISFGSAAVFESGEATYIAATHDSTNDKVVVVYRDGANSSYGTAAVGTVSGTSISFGTPVVFYSGTVSFVGSTFDSNSGKVVIAYRDGSDSNHGKARVGTVSGTSISFGSAVEYNTGNTPYNALTFDSTNNKVILAYRDVSNSNYGTARVGTVSGTSISFGSESVFESGESNYIQVNYDSANQKVLITYRDEDNSGDATSVVGTVSGTSISFGTPVVFFTGAPASLGAAYVGSNKIVNAYQDNTDNNYGKAVVFTSNSVTTNLTTENYIGIAAEAISNGATGKINIATGINDGQTGLTTGQKYYVQNNGSLATSAGSPSVAAGTAISSTKIIVKG